MALSDLVGRLAPRRASAAPPDGPLGVVVTNLAHLGDLLAMLPMLARLRNSARISRLGLVIGHWGRPILQLGRLADTVHQRLRWSLAKPWAPRRTPATAARHLCC